MSELSNKQSAALEQVLAANSRLELIDALETFEGTLPSRSDAKREKIAAVLIEKVQDTPIKRAKKLSRLLAALACIDTPCAAETVAQYATGDPHELGDRVPIWALISLSRMASCDDKCSLLEGVLTDGHSNSRIEALSLRLLIQCSGDNTEARNRYIDQLMTMGRAGDADLKWAVMRSLRNDPSLNPLPPDLERRVVNELAALTLKDDFEWRDVQIQAAMLLGDVQERLKDAIHPLTRAFHSSSDATLRRYYVESIRKVAERMDKGERDASPFGEVMLKALEDDHADVRSRAYEALRSVLGPKAATELVIDSLLQQDAPSAGHLEALRNIDEMRASSLLRENLFHLNPDVAQKASEALIQLGGDQAFRTLFAQRRQAIEQYTDILNDADDKIMGQYNSLMGQARSAFWISMLMHTGVFLLGIGLFAGSILYYFGTSATSPEGVLSVPEALLGAGGGLVATYLGLFYKNPVDNIGSSVTSLVKVNVAFLGFMRQINQVDATFKQLFLDTSGFSLDQMKETVDQVRTVVDESLEKIQTYLAVDASASSRDTASRLVQQFRANAAGAGIGSSGER